MVDYENDRMHGLDGLSTLTEDSQVCIFYSKNADNLTFDLHRILNEAKARIVYQKVEVGTRNALDFQLSSYLGYLIRDNLEKKDETYYIVTKDGGFSSLVSFWTKQDIKVRIVMDCTGKDDSKAKDELLSQVEAVIKDQAIASKVAKFIQQYKTKQGINNALMKEFKDGKRAGEIYNAIKPLIVDKKGE